MEIITKYFTDFTERQLKQYAALKGLYEEWNQKINVISRKDMDHFYEHHVLHSLSIATQFHFPSGYEIMDLGTGGGFPGIPLAIMFPEVHFHLVDSINKKKLPSLKQLLKHMDFVEVVNRPAKKNTKKEKQILGDIDESVEFVKKYN